MIDCIAERTMRSLFVLEVIDLHLFCVGPIVGEKKNT
jgi:hypothetical protein